MPNLTGKTIGQLTTLTGITQDTLFPVELSGNTYNLPYSSITHNTSATCITDLYVTNLNSCSPLHIQPTNVGNVYIGEGGGVNVGIGTSNPSYLLDVNGTLNANTIQANTLSVTTSISGDGSLLNNIPTSGIFGLDAQLINFNIHISDSNNPHNTSLGNLFGGSAHTHTISEITDFGSYSASSYSLITAHTLNFNNPHQTSLGNLFGGSAHTHTISEIIDLNNQLNNKIESTGGTITGSLIVQQDFTVLGTATTINTETLSIENNLITLNSNLTGSTDQPFFGKSGIEILRGSATTTTLLWDESNDYWVAGLTGNTKQIVLSGDSLNLLNSGHTHPISEITDLQTNLNNKFDKTGGTISGSVSATTISATTFYGDGSNLTGLITTDYYVTGGTFSDSTLTLRRNGLPDVPITGFTSTGDYLSLSGGTVTGNTTFATGLTLTNLTGTTDRIVEVDVSGNVSAERRIISAYITGSTEITLLNNPSNWSSGVYVGTAITGTYQGQKHYDSNYFFEAVADNVWIRLSRV